MKQLIIVGAGGFGREALQWATRSEGFRRDWEIKGFLDARPQAIASFPDIGLPILGSPDAYHPNADEVFVCALGSTELKFKLYQTLSQRGAVFTRLIHDTAVIGRNVELQQGVIVAPFTVLSCDIAVGANSAIHCHSFIGHDTRIGPHCHIGAFCDLTGFARIGEQVKLGSRVTLLPFAELADLAQLEAGSIIPAPCA